MNKKAFLKDLSTAYKGATVNPLVHSLGLAAVGVPLAYLFRRPLTKVINSIGKDPRANTLMGMSSRETDQNLAQLERDPMYKHGIPLAVGLTPALVALAMNIRPNSPNYGLTSWNDQGYLKKNASLWDTYGYQPTVDFSMPVHTRAVVDIIRENPYMQKSPYQIALGTSIIAGARQQGNMTNLGAIYDSAVDKFDTKLNFQGVANKAVKSTVKGALAGMFTDVIGSVVGLPNPLRRQVANTAGFATAITSILK